MKTRFACTTLAALAVPAGALAKTPRFSFKMPSIVPGQSIGGVAAGMTKHRLAGTEIESDAFFENALKPGSLIIPRSRLEGRAPFSIRHTVGPDGGCARRSEYVDCTQSGRLTLTLRFKRAR